MVWKHISTVDDKKRNKCGIIYSFEFTNIYIYIYVATETIFQTYKFQKIP